jgi:hypothetical protein
VIRLLLYDIRSHIIDGFLKLGSEFPPIEGTKRYPAIDLELRVTYGRIRLADRFIYAYGIDAVPASQLSDLVAVAGVNAVLGVAPAEDLRITEVPYICLESTNEAAPVLVVKRPTQWHLTCQLDPSAVMDAYQLIRDQLGTTEEC